MLVPIRTYENYIPANMVMQRLEAEGIVAHLQDENTVTTIPLGPIKLMVRREQAARAIELLNEWEKEYREAGVCPQCGSHNITLIPQSTNPGKGILDIVSWLFSSTAAKMVYKCSDCQYEFENIS